MLANTQNSKPQRVAQIFRGSLTRCDEDFAIDWLPSPAQTVAGTTGALVYDPWRQQTPSAPFAFLICLCNFHRYEQPQACGWPRILYGTGRSRRWTVPGILPSGANNADKSKASMSTIESLSELVIWSEYRDFMKERLKQLPSGDVPFLISKTKIDFKLGSAVWKGYAAMVGSKGAATAKLLKKDGLQFREGTCQVQGTELVVKDLDASAVKAAAETLKKLQLGFSISGEEDAEEEDAKATAGTSASGEAADVAKIEARRQELLGEIADVEKLKDPANKAVIEQAKKAAEAVAVAVGRKQYDKVEKLFDSIEGLLSQVVEGPAPAPDADPDLPGIGDWDDYRAFIKAQVKRLPKEGGPAFISRETVTFTIKDKPFQSHVILVGKKGQTLVRILARVGTRFMEGSARLDGALLRVAGLKMALLKGAARTMAKLRAGYKIVPEGALPPDEDEEAQDATLLDPIENASVEKEIKEIAELLVKLSKEIITQKKSVAALKQDADDKRKAAEAAAKRAKEHRDKGAETDQDRKDVGQANEAAETAKFKAKRTATDADRAAAELSQFTETLRRIRDAVDSDKNKHASLKELKDSVNGRLQDMDIVNIDTNGPEAGKVIADQIKKRFGVSLQLYESTIQGRDAKGNQIIKDSDKEVDPKKEAAMLKELYVTLSRAPVFPASHLTSLTVSLRPAAAESEGGVYYGDSKSVEVTCKRPAESFNYGNQLNSASYFPDGVDENCKAANSDPVNYFDWATLHEVAHAVDAKNQFMDKKGAAVKYGAWKVYGQSVEPIAGVVANKFGSSLAAPEKTKLENYALTLMKNGDPGAPTTPEQRAVKDWVDKVRVGKTIWWDGNACKNLAIGGRVYQEAYDGGWWNSYDLAARRQGIHGYQFRAPGEWFAELYAAYYSDKLKPSHPFVPDLAELEQPTK
jgi:hypothetical protein